MMRYFLPCCLLFLFLGGGCAYAESTEQKAQRVFSQINSPFCKGRLLRDCPSSGASGLKEEVRGLVEEGHSEDAIVAMLYQKYGDELRAVPTDSFVGTLAWVAPFGFLLFGGIIAVVWLKRSSGGFTN